VEEEETVVSRQGYSKYVSAATDRHKNRGIVGSGILYAVLAEAMYLIAAFGAVNLSVHQDGERLSTGILELLDTEVSITEICHAIMKKYPDATSVVQQVYKVFSDIENLVG
jgi:hypothetical protein